MNIELLTKKQTAKRLNICERTLHRKVKSGELYLPMYAGRVNWSKLYRIIMVDDRELTEIDQEVVNNKVAEHLQEEI